MKYNRILSATLIIAAISMVLPSCTKVSGKGPVVTETRSIGSNFSSVYFAVPGTITYQYANAAGVVIEAQQNIIDRIETYISGNELKVKVRDNTVLRNHEEIRILVSGPMAEKISQHGSGEIHIKDRFQPANLRLESNGSGRISIDQLETGFLDARIEGSGDILVSQGRLRKEKAVISGSGRFELLNLEADTAYTQTNGSGDIRLWAREYLDCRISGSGNVAYKGSPQINLSVSGSGKLIHLP
ncbi:DUF2807 domain-containing protein [Flavihumibacter rivuli]|uniref:head GIN domain-containing protein n=1 Tax=Flavihumibacter rivuli TaxID=2838156 RepID=UPI001BDF3BED|nr:head GIN domain-containing protein [Flavihumibacter rivuli]ULQ57184.1 DUF2807 domain-containing protein [Flavihumibacter rivuli]